MDVDGSKGVVTMPYKGIWNKLFVKMSCTNTIALPLMFTSYSFRQMKNNRSTDVWTLHRELKILLLQLEVWDKRKNSCYCHLFLLSEDSSVILCDNVTTIYLDHLIFLINCCCLMFFFSVFNHVYSVFKGVKQISTAYVHVIRAERTTSQF